MEDRTITIIAIVLVSFILAAFIAFRFAFYSEFISGLGQEPTIAGFIGFLIGGR